MTLMRQRLIPVVAAVAVFLAALASAAAQEADLTDLFTALQEAAHAGARAI